jgi:hypothetical protein
MLAILWRMPRPKKDPSLLREEILRIPVSLTEKQHIHAAALGTDGEFARWARAILLKAADAYSALQAKKRGPEHKARGGRLKETA